MLEVTEFTPELQSNNLTSHKPYTKKQQLTFNLIKYLHDKKRWGYRVKINQNHLVFLKRLWREDCRI